ncbi:MAG: glycosyltransferase family protein [Planctomycetaceae bacterium]
MKRLLLLCHDRKAASFRVRWERHLEPLAAAGIACDVREIPGGGGGRAALFAEAARFDGVVLQRRLLGARDFARLRRAARVLVYDFDDALLFRPSAPHRSCKRRTRFFRTVRGADLVLAGNRILAGYARLAARAVAVVPSTADTEAIRPAAPAPGFRVVWIGQRATLPHLETVRAALLDAGRSIPGFTLRVVADAAPPEVEFLPWSEAAELEALASAHAGIMPLPDDPFARGKCAYKLLLYYAAGLPAIVSPVGANRPLAAGGGALLARTPGEWEAALRRLAADPALRARLGARGRAFVERGYAARLVPPRLAALLLGALPAEPRVPVR